jgi:ribosome-binding factor A
MRPHRREKIASLLEQELGQLLIREIDFEGAIVTILKVDVSEDLGQAKISLGIIPYEKEPAAFLKVQEKSRELQHKLLRKMNIRPMPKLEFEIVSGKSAV